MRALNTLLLAMIIVSLLGIIAARHSSRNLFVELQNKQQARLQLNHEWGRLLLERATLANQSRIEKIARNRYHMHYPSQQERAFLMPHTRLASAAPGQGQETP